MAGCQRTRLAVNRTGVGGRQEGSGPLPASQLLLGNLTELGHPSSTPCGSTAELGRTGVSSWVDCGGGDALWVFLGGVYGLGELGRRVGRPL